MVYSYFKTERKKTFILKKKRNTKKNPQNKNKIIQNK